MHLRRKDFLKNAISQVDFPAAKPPSAAAARASEFWRAGRWCATRWQQKSTGEAPMHARFCGLLRDSSKACRPAPLTPSESLMQTPLREQNLKLTENAIRDAGPARASPLWLFAFYLCDRDLQLGRGLRDARRCGPAASRMTRQPIGDSPDSQCRPRRDGGPQLPVDKPCLRAQTMPRRRGFREKVLLNAVIGKDGTVGKLDVRVSSERTQTVTSLDAVRQWFYKLDLLNGRQQTMKTTITVIYHHSPR